MDFRIKQPQATIFDDLRLFCSAALLATLHLVRFASASRSTILPSKSATPFHF